MTKLRGRFWTAVWTPEAEHSRGSLVFQKMAPPDPCLCKKPLLNHKINKRVGGELLGRKGESETEE